MQDRPLSIEVIHGSQNREVVLRLSGPLVLNSIFDFQRAWRAEDGPNIVVDLSGVPYVDSSGIGSLVNLHVSRQKKGGELFLAGVSDRVMTALAVTKVDKIFSFRSSPFGRSISA